MSESSWSPKDEEVLLGAHQEALMAESQSEIRTLGERLANLTIGPKERNRERIGDAVLRTLRAETRPQALTEPIGDMRPGALAQCQTLDPPVFSISSHEEESPTIFSRADAAARTLQVRARTGWNGERYPSSAQFILGYNKATASLGAPIAIPPHGPAVILDVRVGLQIETIWSNAPVEPGTAAQLIWTHKGNGDLPLRGTAVAWCRAGLTLVGANGARSGRSVRFVSEWRNRDGQDQEDSAPGGLVTLNHAVAISSELVVAGIFVDVTCFAAAEESETNESDSAYAELKCRDGDGFPVPSRLRLDPQWTRVRLCEMPVLGG
jgi:hypothetical protein